MQRGLVIPPQPIIQREPASDLPGVLSEDSNRPLAKLGVLAGVHAGAVSGTQQEAGVRKADIAAVQSGLLQIGKTRFGGAEIERASSAALIHIAPDVFAPFAAGFERVVAV